MNLSRLLHSLSQIDRPPMNGRSPLPVDTRWNLNLDSLHLACPRSASAPPERGIQTVELEERP